MNAIENNDVMKMFCAVLKLSRTTAAPQKNKKIRMRAVPKCKRKKGKSDNTTHTRVCPIVVRVCVRVLM